MILSGARVAADGGTAVRADVEIEGSRIKAVRTARRVADAIRLDGYLLLPGLINAHDHLDFALFPRLGRGPYPNATCWAHDIYRPNESPVREHLRVPRSVRLLWGALRNLFAGVTTLCHHDPVHRVFRQGFPVRVLRRFGWAHSLAFDPSVTEKHRRTPRDAPFILHLGEAVDGAGRREIFELDRLGALDDRTVLVHAVALDAQGRELVKQKRASLIWCPSSNLFLLGRTVAPEVFRSGIPVALGTDSPLTAAGDLLDELRLARRISGLEAEELYRMVTTAAARVLQLSGGEGAITEGASADLCAFPDDGAPPAELLLNPDTRAPSLVIVGGEVALVEPALAERLPAPVRRRLEPLALEGKPQRLVRADVRKLYRRATAALGEPLFLGGKRVTV
jgi:cytosine/adenosine deaminase-related metal-dependent hydrolase